MFLFSVLGRDSLDKKFRNNLKEVPEMSTQNFFKKISVQDFLILERCIGNPDNPVYRSSPPEVFCKKGVLRNFARGLQLY